MTKFTVKIAAACAAMLFTAGAANAADWSTSWTGPRGATGTRNVHCGYYACGYSAQGVGPSGQAWSRSGGVVHGPYRSYGYRSFTGPNGNTHVARRVWPRY